METAWLERSITTGTIGIPPLTARSWGISRRVNAVREAKRPGEPVLKIGKNEIIQPETREEPGFKGIVGQSSAIRETLEQVKTVASSRTITLNVQHRRHNRDFENGLQSGAF